MSEQDNRRGGAAPGDGPESAAMGPEATPKNARKQDKEARLAAALRENLRRRKAAQRKEQD
ncbi:MAG: hypothetical protein GC153_04160 [Alphaproteobacteria bacterium]|nr:hypothetical protein [Alphaproteobacteria bacterium]